MRNSLAKLLTAKDPESIAACIGDLEWLETVLKTAGADALIDAPTETDPALSAGGKDALRLCSRTNHKI